jgi:type II secretory pathway component GspD/PulD (secretin)
MKQFKQAAVLAMAVMAMGMSAPAQTPTEKDKSEKPATRPADTRPLKTYYLKFAGHLNDGNEILTGMRLMLDPVVKLYFVPSQNAIMMRATEDQFVLAEQILHDIDRPRPTYRLTYTLTEWDAGKKIGVQHFSMIAADGQRTTMKEGSRLPIATGSVNEEHGTQTQMTYLDIGMNFDATPQQLADGFSLKSKVEQSSVAPEISGVGPADPIVRQAVLEGTSTLTLGKPLVLGALDIPGSTRHLDVEVLAELVK